MILNPIKAVYEWFLRLNEFCIFYVAYYEFEASPYK